MGLTEVVGMVLLSGTGGGVLVAVVKNFLARRQLGADADKTEADAAAVLSKTALELVQPLREQIRELNEQLDRVKVKAENLEHQLDVCQASNRDKSRVIAEKDDEIARLRAHPSRT